MSFHDVSLALALLFGFMFWAAMAFSAPWLLIASCMSRDWDCALGGLFTTLIVWGFTFLAIANLPVMP